MSLFNLKQQITIEVNCCNQIQLKIEYIFLFVFIPSPLHVFTNMEAPEYLFSCQRQKRASIWITKDERKASHIYFCRNEGVRSRCLPHNNQMLASCMICFFLILLLPVLALFSSSVEGCPLACLCASCVIITSSEMPRCESDANKFPICISHVHFCR